ncbi:MAG: hypothetical protein CL920_19650 [Deltaproteobacteria bacterium]|nr:hypothetical protein [Deltaproteobacteria bacterium]
MSKINHNRPIDANVALHRTDVATNKTEAPQQGQGVERSQFELNGTFQGNKDNDLKFIEKRSKMDANAHVPRERSGAGVRGPRRGEQAGRRRLGQRPDQLHQRGLKRGHVQIGGQHHRGEVRGELNANFKGETHRADVYSRPHPHKKRFEMGTPSQRNMLEMNQSSAPAPLGGRVNFQPGKLDTRADIGYSSSGMTGSNTRNLDITPEFGSNKGQVNFGVHAPVVQDWGDVPAALSNGAQMALGLFGGDK